MDFSIINLKNETGALRVGIDFEVLRYRDWNPTTKLHFIQREQIYIRRLLLRINSIISIYR